MAGVAGRRGRRPASRSSSRARAASTASRRSSTSRATRTTSPTRRGRRCSASPTAASPARASAAATGKLGYLPLAHSDFIFAVIAEELGLHRRRSPCSAGSCCSCGSASRPRSPRPTASASLLAGGIAAWFGVQAIINIGGVTGLMPVTGLTLPFFSAGGTSLFVTMVAAGLLLNVARRAVTCPRCGRRAGDARRQAVPPVTRTFAVVTGGGTAGHVLPALAVAEALVRSRPRRRRRSTTSAPQRGIETRLLPPTPFPHTFFDVVGFQRALTRRNLGFVPKLLAGRSARPVGALLRELRPAGRGVASAATPACRPCWRPGGSASRSSSSATTGSRSVPAALAARVAAACAVAFPDSPLPRASSPARRCGRPSSTSTVRRDRAAARARARPARRPVRRGRDGRLAGLGRAQRRGRRAGRRSRATTARWPCATSSATASSTTPRRRPTATTACCTTSIGYEDRMRRSCTPPPTCWSGAAVPSTVPRSPSPARRPILVPWPGAAEDHQTDNVRWLADAGAAVLLAETEIERLGRRLDALRADPVDRAALAAAAHELGRCTAAAPCRARRTRGSSLSPS